jgi:hypothetical protein
MGRPARPPSGSVRVRSWRPRFSPRDSLPGSESNATMRALSVVVALVAVGLLLVTTVTVGATTSLAAPWASSSGPALLQPMNTVSIAITHDYAGYLVPHAKTIRLIEGDWNVPRINGSCPAKTEVAFVGIDLGGYNTPRASFVGTEILCYLGVAHYASYYTIGTGAAAGTLTIAPGNRMHATITYSPAFHQLRIFLQDTTKGTSTSNSATVTLAAHTEALWTVGAGFSTSTGRLEPLVDFGKVTFSNCNAEVNGTTLHTLGHYNNTALEMYNKTSTAFKADVSAITSTTKGFTVRWDSTGP